jgi:hypothetical protein
MVFPNQPRKATKALFVFVALELYFYEMTITKVIIIFDKTMSSFFLR